MKEVSLSESRSTIKWNPDTSNSSGQGYTENVCFWQRSYIGNFNNAEG